MNAGTAELAIHKTLTVKATQEHAFAVFTDGIATWWPLETHSVGGESARSVTLEPRAGGRLYESVAGGGESDWGRVLAWEPPSRLLLTWHPGRDAGEATELEVRFAAAGQGTTRVELEHRGWEVLGAPAAASVASYDEGWNGVLAAYAEAAVR